MSEPAPHTDRPTHARWIVFGLVLGIVVSLESRVIWQLADHETMRTCGGPDICLIRHQRPWTPFTSARDQIYVGDQQEICGTVYPTPFKIRGSRLHVRFTGTSAVLIAPDGTRARYLFGEC